MLGMAMQQNNYNDTIKRLQPYVDLGSNSIPLLQTAMGYNPDGSVNTSNILQQQFSAPTAEQAQATPGYQFTLDQGLKATQNSAAARGLGVSGAALKGAATYASGLADSTYNDVYTRALNTFNTNYSSASQNAARLQGLVNNGQNAANNTGTLGAAASSGIAGSAVAAGNALAGGTVGAAAATASGYNSLANGLGSYAAINNASSGGSSYDSGFNGQSNPANQQGLTNLMNQFA